jgi:outer membrane receptor protein involved in Fe transport
LSFQRSLYDDRDNYAYVNDYLLPVAPPSQDILRVRENYVVLTASADYTLPLSGGRSLKLGYDLEDDTAYLVHVGGNVDPVSGQVVNNPAITNQFHYHQQINAAYGQYEASSGKWTMQTGVRLERNNIDDLLVTGAIATNQSYFRAYPGLHLDRALGGDGKVSFSMSRRVSWPDADDIDPFVDSRDIHNLRAGDPGLLPQDTWSYEIAGAGKFKTLDYLLTAYYRFDRDRVSQITKPVSADVTLTTSENLPKSKSAGFEFSGNGKLGSRITYALSGNFFYNQIDGGALAQGGLRDTIGLNAKASLDWRPTSADTAQISFSRTDSRLTPQGYIGASNLINLGLRHQLSGGLSVVATVTDLSDGQRYQRIVTTPTLQDNYSRHLLGRIGYVGLSYGFGPTKKAKPTSFEYDQGNPK